MAGTLVANTINTDTGIYSTNNALNGVAKAWVNWDGQTSPNTNIRASYNVSSITYSSTGTWTINFATALSSVNAVCLGTSGYNYLAVSTGDIGACGMLTTSTAWYQNSLGSGSNRNPAVCQFAAFIS